jgi:hypothetical protein
MSFGLIVLVTFVLVILGIHLWCHLHDLRNPPSAHRQAAWRRSVKT